MFRFIFFLKYVKQKNPGDLVICFCCFGLIYNFGKNPNFD